MERPANTARVWRFGVFEVDAAGGELRRGGRPVKMREQSFRILVFLLEHCGEIVTRDSLRGVLWPSDTFVDFDHSLNTAMMKLRDALGDSAETPLYIETLPKRGYRFIAPMTIAEREARSISPVTSSWAASASVSTGDGNAGAAVAEEGFRVTVLPFGYSGGDAAVAAIAEGLSEGILAGLQRFSYLRVIVSRSISRYASDGADVRSVGQELGARYVIEGDLRQAGSRLRIAARLVDASSGTNLWAETYERSFEAEGAFELQDDLVPRIVSTVADGRGVLPRTISEALRNKNIEKMSPYEAVLRSFAHFQRVSEEEHAAATAALERAVQLTPGHADCWAMLSLLYKEEYAHGLNVRPDPLGRAFAAAQRVIEADPSNHLGYHALASVLYFQRDFEAFRVAAERAIALNRMDGFTIAYLGFLVAYSGEWERGCALVERARSLNPHHPGWYWFAHLFDAYRMRSYRSAAEIGLKINMPRFWRTNVALAAAYGQLGETDAAHNAVQALLASRPDFGWVAREELAKWWDPKLVEHLIDGLRKAGLEIAGTDAGPGHADRAETRLHPERNVPAPTLIAPQLGTALNGTSEAPQLTLTHTEEHARRRRFRWTVAVIGVLLVAAAASFWFLRARHVSAPIADDSQHVSTFQIVPITSAPGDAILPAFSPDGREIAFAWDGPERKSYDIYVQLIGAELPLRLTHTQRGVVGAPAWSPDGSEIAFSRCDGTNDGVFVVPALGGTERQLTTVGCLYTLPGPLAWLADSKEILMIDHCSGDGPFGVVRFSLTTGEKHCLTNSGSPKGSDAGYGFSLSPDGRTIALARSAASLCCNVYTVPISGGTPRLLTEDHRIGCSTLNEFGCARLMWTPDSKFIIFVSHRTTLPSLWRVPAAGGAIERETTYPAPGSFSKDGRRFVYSEKTTAQTPSIWRANLASAGGPVSGNRKLIQTQYPEMDAQPSPDGTRIVWMSIRTGSEELWTSDAMGQGSRQLTHLDRYSGTPRWSPDGRWIAFDSYTPDGARIFVVDLEGRNLHSITNGPGDDVVPSWSRDGKSIYFTSKRTGDWQAWKHSLMDGKESQLTEHGGFDPFESYGSQTIYFSKFDHAGIWSVPAGGGGESLVMAKKPQLGYWGHWAVTRAGLYVLDTDAEPRATIDFYDFATRRTSSVLTLDMRPARQQPSLSATADGRAVYYTQYDPQSVIKMIEFSR